MLDLRARQQRNFLATMLLSQGIPMLLQGDEFGRSQGGNNNAYCQDNEISWVDWDDPDLELLGFARNLTRLRAEHPVFRRRRFFAGRGGLQPGHRADIAWLRPDGTLMTDDDWPNTYARSMAVFLNGAAIAEPGTRGERVADDSFLMLFNAHHEDLDFVLPGASYGSLWASVIDTSDDTAATRPLISAGSEVPVRAHSLVVLTRPRYGYAR